MENTEVLEERFKLLADGCENEMLHLSGHIQPFGALVATDFNGLITHVSANLSEYYPQSTQYVLGRNLQEIDEHLFDSVKYLSIKPGSSHAYFGAAKFNNTLLDVYISSSSVGYVIEIEPSSSESFEQSSLHHLQLKLLTVPTDSDEVEAYSHLLTDAIKEVSGFDRVMIYKFLEDGSGEVIAESANDGIGSYFGLRYPASDIPQIARNIYLLNPFRLIPDINASPVLVHSLQEDILDLTYSDLRSVSPVHIEYLKHMGVRASFSLPIKINGHLWGLVACHHLTPRFISLEQRERCSSLTQCYSIGISTFTTSRYLKVMDAVDRKINTILEELSSSEYLLGQIRLNSHGLMELIASCGTALATHEEIITIGKAPDSSQIKELDRWFTEELQESLYSSNNMVSLKPEFKKLANNIAGVMAVKVKSSKSGWVRFYWFRQEEPEEVTWAGNPNKPGAEDPNATALSPRKSFEKWTEIKHGFSKPWSSDDKVAGMKFRNTLFRWI